MITPRSQLTESGNAIPLPAQVVQGNDQDGDNNNNVHLLIEHSYSCLSSQEHSDNISNGTPIVNGNGSTRSSNKAKETDCTSTTLEPREESIASTVVPKGSHLDDVSNTAVHSLPSQADDSPSKASVLSVEASSNGMSLRTRSGRERKVPAKLLDGDFIDTSEISLSSNRKSCGDSTPSTGVPVPSPSITKENRRNSKGVKAKETVAEPAVASESEEESEDGENDDDEYKEYCICRQPHGNKFMIGCDNCENWFHGKCIGVSKKQSENYEVWICSTCKEGNPSLECKLKVTTPVEMSDGRKRLSSESSDGNKINDRAKRTGLPSKGSDVRIKKLSKVEGAKSSSKSADKPNDETSEEERDRRRLKDLIDKRKRELAEKEKKRDKKLALLDPTMNQLFQIDSDTSLRKKTPVSDHMQPLMRCVVCATGKLKKLTTVYCSLECMKKHVKHTRKTKRRSSIVSTSTESTMSKEETTESTVKSSLPSNVIDTSVNQVNPLPPPPASPSSKHPTPLPVKTEADPATPSPAVGENSTEKKCEKSIESPSILYPAYDAFDVKDTADAVKRKKDDVPERELLHFLIRNPSYTFDPSMKIKYRIRKSSETGESTSSKDSRRTSLDSTTKSPSVHKIIPPAKRKSESDTHPPLKSPKASHDSTPKSATKVKPTDKSPSSSVRSEDVRQRVVREKVEKSFVDALNSRITCATHLSDEEKDKRKNSVANLCKNIESELFKLHAVGGKLSDTLQKNYLSKYRSLIFNLKDTKNQLLFDSIFKSIERDTASVAHAISPADLVKMSSEELARGSDLDEWRKEETKKSIINSVIMNEEQLEASQSIKPLSRKSQDGVTSEIDLIATLPVDTLMDAAKSDASTSRSDSSTKTNHQPVKIRMSKSKSDFNPLDIIFNEISTTSKSKKEAPIDDVPRSPPREKKRREEHTHRSKDRSDRDHKKKRDSDHEKRKSDRKEDKKSTSSHGKTGAKTSNVAVKRVTIHPKLPELMNVDLLSGEINQEDVEKFITPVRKVKKVIWDGFCSGFEESSAANSKEPATSRFPLLWLKSPLQPTPKDEGYTTLTSDFASLNVVGRIAPDQVSSYLEKLVQSNGNDADSIIDLIPLTLGMKRKKLPVDEYEDEDDYLVDDEICDEADEQSLSFKENYDKFISYLVTRKRYAVVDVKIGKKLNLKDMYLLPLDLSTVTDHHQLKRQMHSDILLQIFSRTPSCADIRSEVNDVRKMILLVLLIKKSNDKRRERSSSTSGVSIAPGQLKYIPSVKSTNENDIKQMPEERSFTPPLPPAPVTIPMTSKASLSQQYQPTPINFTSSPHTTHKPLFPLTERTLSIPLEEENITTSYIPGLSPDRDEPPDDPMDVDDEEELKKKAILQMQLLNYTPL